MRASNPASVYSKCLVGLKIEKKNVILNNMLHFSQYSFHYESTLFFLDFFNHKKTKFNVMSSDFEIISIFFILFCLYPFKNTEIEKYNSYLSPVNARTNILYKEEDVHSFHSDC